jgi:hypothetical protein
MTALLAIESTEQGCNPCSTMASVYTHPNILCDSNNQPGGAVGGSDALICGGETNTLQRLIWHMMFPSGNDAAFGIADLIINPGTTCANTSCQDIFDFVDLMNDRATELGMTDTIYENPSGAAHPNWPSRNASSPWDQAHLAHFAMQNTTFFNYVSQAQSPVLPRIGGCWTAGSTSTWNSGVFTFVGVGGGPNFVNTVGIKPGSTGSAGQTLVVALDEPAGRMFGLIYGEPSGNAMRTDMGAMLTLGSTTFCSGTFDPTPPPPGQVITYGNTPSSGGGTAHFGLHVLEEADRGLNVRITPSEGTPAARGRLELNRYRSMVLPAGESTVSTVAPFISHQGMLITNVGEQPCTLAIIAGTAYTATVVLNAGDSHSVPAFVAPASTPEHSVVIANVSSTADAMIEVKESRYAYETYVETGSSYSVRMTVDRAVLEDNVDVLYTGTDPNAAAMVDVMIANTLDQDPGCNGEFDLDDVSAFVQALMDPAAYQANYPACYIGSADRNQDGRIDGLDVQVFTSELLAP